MKKENKNFLYNCLYQLFVFIIPLVTTPYISRILGVDNIGIYSYTYSIVYYFMLATMLGINNYGSREISKASSKNDKKYLSNTFCSIYYLQLFIGIIMCFLYFFVVIVFFSKYKLILFYQSIFLFSAVLDINWFFFGMEKFKITISRNIIIKTLSMVLIFLLIKSSSDLYLYVLILSISTLISQIYLWFNIFKYVELKKIPFINIFKNLKPCLVLFIPVIAYSIYRVMDKTMLGAISGTISLGYYENAEKIINIPIAFINALGTVMLPNMSKVIDEEQFMKKIYNSFYLVLLFIVPMFFGLLCISKNFSLIFFGNKFEKSGIIISLLSITIIFSAISNVIRTNYLIPKKKDDVYVKSTIIGAILNLIFNSILIPFFSFYGACYGTIIAEMSVMLYQLFNVKEQIELSKLFKIISEHFIKSTLMFFVIVVIGFLISNIYVKLLVQLLVAILIIFILNYKYILYDFLSLKK